MFDRLVGLETEYAIRCRSHEQGGPRVLNSVLYESLIEHLKSKVPVAGALIEEQGWFLVNGGAVRFERHPLFAFLPSAGLVEGATPECRGPRQLLRYQRAQDALLSQAVATGGRLSGEAALLKNNCDSQGNYYGSHENYEAAIASRDALFFWRLLVLLLLPMSFLVVVTIVAVTIVAGLCVIPVLILRRYRPGYNPPRAWEIALSWLAYLSLLPTMLVAEVLVRLTAFRRLRRHTLAFLVSRPIVAGAGTVDAQGRFGLSPRAAVVRSLCSTGGDCLRPVFYFGYLWKGALGTLLGDVDSYRRLFHSWQRLQITIGDSNMAQHAEYLKIGTTLLVLDAIEAGALADAPRLRQPLRALRTICADPSLQVSVPLTDGRRWTAMQIQRYYLDGCRRFVVDSGVVSEEADAVLKMWQETLDALERDPLRLVGKLDWVTKRYLLDEAGEGATLEARRKIDLRYHELSRDGYYMQLEAAGIAPTLVEPEDVLEATRTPPEGTPATLRGQLIRQFAAGTQPIRASWQTVVIGSGKGTRVVHLTRDGAVPAGR